MLDESKRGSRLPFGVPPAVLLWLAAGLAVSIAVLWAFAEIVDEVVEGESRRFDAAALLWINASFPDWLAGPMRLVAALGYYWVVLILMSAATFVFYRRGRRISAALILTGTAGGMVLNTVLKNVFERTRPDLIDTGYTAGSYSFPSGHATIAVAFYGTLTLLVMWRLEGWRRWLVAVSGLLFVLLLGFSRLYLAVHYPTDVAAGYLSATIWVGFVGAVLLFWRTLRKGARS